VTRASRGGWVQRASGGLLTVWGLAPAVLGLWALVAGPWAGEGPGTNLPPAPSAAAERALGHLRAIAAAQEAYRARDWDGDGLQRYVSFLPHLWQSVDAAGHPLPLRLIERDLAFAVGPRRLRDGYSFEALQERVPARMDPSWDGRVERLDAGREWAVVAHPMSPSARGELPVLLVLGPAPELWARSPAAGRLGLVPDDPAQAGWRCLGPLATATIPSPWPPPPGGGAHCRPRIAPAGR